MVDLRLYGSIDGSRSWWVAWMCRELGIGYQSQHAEGYLDPYWEEPATRVLALAAVYDGPADAGERVTAPLRSFGTALLDFGWPLGETRHDLLDDPSVQGWQEQRNFFRMNQNIPPT